MSEDSGNSSEEMSAPQSRGPPRTTRAMRSKTKEELQKGVE